MTGASEGRSLPAGWDRVDLGWLGVAPSDLGTIAVIVATVDLERALADAGLDAALATAANEDPHLGARVVAIPARAGQDDPVALAEPSSEGRLAATLARHDEGAIGRYVRAPGSLDAVRRRASRAGIPVSRPADGPFGRSILVIGPATGPHLILVEDPAVPSRP
jgi:hypothetical protein